MVAYICSPHFQKAGERAEPEAYLGNRELFSCITEAYLRKQQQQNPCLSYSSSEEKFVGGGFFFQVSL